MSAPLSGPTPTRSTRVVLSSLEGVVQLLATKPELLRIPAFSGLAPLVAAVQSHGPGCNGCTVAELHDRYRDYFSAALRGITGEDVARLKQVLQVAEVCYYRRGKGGELEKVCL